MNNTLRAGLLFKREPFFRGVNDRYVPALPPVLPPALPPTLQIQQQRKVFVVNVKKKNTTLIWL